MNNTLFHLAIEDIYPVELTLKKTSESSTSLSYLDIQITMLNGKYSTAVYDKRDDFNFKIVTFPFYVPTFRLNLHMESIFPS